MHDRAPTSTTHRSSAKASTLRIYTFDGARYFAGIISYRSLLLLLPS